MLNTPGERRAAGRLAALALLAVVVSLSPPVAGAVLAATGAGAALCRARNRTAVRAQTKSFLLVAAFVLVTVGIFSGVAAAVIATARILGLLLIAAVVAASVSPLEMTAVVRALLRPLRPFGLNPDRVALVLSLTITIAPVLLRHARTIREVQRMRGLRAAPRFVLPLLIVALRHADTMAESLAARGV